MEEAEPRLGPGVLDSNISLAERYRQSRFCFVLSSADLEILAVPAAKA